MLKSDMISNIAYFMFFTWYEAESKEEAKQTTHLRNDSICNDTHRQYDFQHNYGKMIIIVFVWGHG